MPNDSPDDFQPPLVLTFAASDPTCGAGIQADLMTLASMGCHPLTVITAITVQDTAGVESAFAIDADWVSDQARALLEDMPVAAFKIGMLGSGDIVRQVGGGLVAAPEIAARSALGRSRKPFPPGLRPIPIVLDPVRVSTSNEILSSSATIS